MLTESDVVRKTQNLLKIHGITNWNVTFGNAKSRAGVTIYSQRIIRFSRYLLAIRSDEGTQDTIKHEVAHVIAGIGTGHGPTWQKIYKDLGGSGNTEWDIETLTTDRAFRWVYHCPGCGVELGRSFRKWTFTYKSRKTGRTSPKVTRCCRKFPTANPLYLSAA